MKNKHFLVFLILLISIIVVIFYAYRLDKIDHLFEEFYEIKYSTQELIVLDTKQKIELDSLDRQYNYDKITSFNKQLNNFIARYLKNIEHTKDKTLSLLANKIKIKNKKLQYAYEDFKTDNAEIKNSIKLLNTKIKNYLLYPDSLGDIDRELVRKIYIILSAHEETTKEDYKYTKTSNNKIVKNMIKHLNILYVEYEHLHHAKIELQNNNIYGDLKEILSYVDAKLIQLKNEVDKITKSFLIVLVFLIIFSIFVYYKEAISTIKVIKLKNNLQQFVDALDKSAIVSKTDTKGRMTYVNDMLCTVAGYTREELIGKAHNILRHPDMSKDVFKELWQTIQSKKIFRGTIKNRKKDGDYYFVDVVIIPILDIDNNILEYLAIRYEVTELILARDNALVAEKAKDEFLSNMSHELRTPLNSIKGFSDILTKLVKDEKELSYLKNITDSSEQLIGLINNILDLSKLQSGKFTLDNYHFNVDEKIAVFLERFKVQLKITGVIMNVNLDSSLKITLNGDWLRISQIITNLISNAIKFTAEGKHINFNMFYKDKKLNIIVEDEGIGLSKEAQSKIFEPFKQADNSTTRKYGGTGLGLSIVLSLVEQMGGEIKLDSTEGVGSKFEIILPIQKVKYEDNEDEKVEDTLRDELKGHILIAEDNKTNQMLIGILIDELGLTYTMAKDGLDAIEKFSKEKFDLVLMDENMPKLNGIEAVKEIYNLYGDSVPIVALTANVMSGDKEKFLAAGMDGYLSKPINEEELYNMLKSFLN